MNPQTQVDLGDVKLTERFICTITRLHDGKYKEYVAYSLIELVQKINGLMTTHPSTIRFYKETATTKRELYLL